MNVHQDFDIVFCASVIEPIDFLGSTVHASNIWSIWIKSPVSYWESNNFNASVSEIRDIGFLVPSIPMGSHHRITFGWTKSFAKSE